MEVFITDPPNGDFSVSFMYCFILSNDDYFFDFLPFVGVTHIYYIFILLLYLFTLSN